MKHEISDFRPTPILKNSYRDSKLNLVGVKMQGDACIITHEINAGPIYSQNYMLRNSYTDEIWQSEKKSVGSWVARMTLADAMKLEEMSDGDNGTKEKLLDTVFKHCKVVDKRLS